MTASIRLRSAARTIVLLDRRAVLLQLHDEPHDRHWACPGGGIEPDESAYDAARRELFEETGRSDELSLTPVWEWEHEFRFAADRVRQHETYFVAYARDAHIPIVEPDAVDGILERRWIELDQIGKLPEPVWPPDLAQRIASIDI